MNLAILPTNQVLRSAMPCASRNRDLTRLGGWGIVIDAAKWQGIEWRETMWIMTVDGWKQIGPREYSKASHTPTMLETMGIDQTYDGIKAMIDYANGSGRGMYFTFKANGLIYQSKGAKHPLMGMYAEQRED